MRKLCNPDLRNLPRRVVPRERASMLVLRQLVSDWETCAIHGSSPGGGGISTLMFRKARNYIPTNLHLDIPLGVVAPSGIRCENLERQISPDGEIVPLMEPEHHGNPISADGSLVTFRYRYDIAELIAGWTPFDVEIRRFHDCTHGIVA